MIHKIISTIGLGILGVDPFTAVYLLSMGLRQEKKSKKCGVQDTLTDFWEKFLKMKSKMKSQRKTKKVMKI